MRITPKYKLNSAIALLCCIGVWGQDKYTKLNEKLTVNNDVVINLNTSHTTVVFETWNKNTLAIQAYVQGNQIDAEVADYVLDNWDVDISGNSREVTINSATSTSLNGAITTSNIRMGEDLKQLRMMSPVIADILEPLMQNIENNPMPKALSNEVTAVKLGKQGANEESYVRQWQEQLNKQGVSQTLTREANAVNGQMEIRIETWTNEYGEQMQAWASRFIKDAQGSDNQNITIRKYQLTNPESIKGVHKIIKVNIPKEAALKLNVRHGGVQLAERATNVIASLSHTNLLANNIEGDRTYIKASFSPVIVKNWKDGKLVINYVKNCKIQNANNIQVNSDSSNIFIQQLDNNGAITGSFGAITIANLGETFSTLDLAVENSDFRLNLPKTPFNVVYNGIHSRISVPKTLETSVRRNFGTVFVNGFRGTRDTEKTINIHAKYSDVLLR